MKIYWITEDRLRDTDTWIPGFCFGNRKDARSFVKEEKAYRQRNKAEEYDNIRLVKCKEIK